MKTFSKFEASISKIVASYQSFLFTLLFILTVVAIFIGKFVFQPLVLVTEWLCKAIYRLC